MVRPESKHSKKFIQGLAVPILIAVLFTGVTPARAEVPAAHKVKVLLTAMSFDKSLKSRAGDKITIVVLGKCGTLAAMQEASGKAINGLPISVQTIEAFKDAGDLTEQLKKFSATALYICEANDAAIGSISSVAGKLKVLTLAEDPSWVEGKIALGVGEKGGRAELILNVNAAKAAGADFDARIFGVARVVQ